MSKLKLNKKHVDLLALACAPSTRLLCLSGTTRSSKTIIAIQAFFYAVQVNSGSRHLIACRDLQAIEENILKSDGLGLEALFPNHVKIERGKLKHIILTIRKVDGTKVTVTLCNYSNKTQWQKILGGTFDIIFVDEVNIADENFINECFARQASSDNPLTMWTLNGDDPEHKIYKEYINCCKPIWNVPTSETDWHTLDIRKPNWYFTHWTMWDNPAMTDEKISNMESIYPAGSYYYKTKILGYRAVAEGAIFAQYMTSEHYAQIDFNEDNYVAFTFGLDLGNNDTKVGTVITLTGFTYGFKEVHVLKCIPCTSTEVNALVDEVCVFIEQFYESIINKSKINSVRVDGFGAIQLIMDTLRNRIKYKNIKISQALKFGDENGRRARLQVLLILIQGGKIKWCSNSKISMDMIKKLVYAKDGLPLDTNQESMDFYDSLGYSITPYIAQINKGGFKI